MKRARWLVYLGFGVFLGMAPSALAQAQDQDLRSILCADCHGGALHDFLSTRHASILYAQGRRDATALCGTCHGEVTAHAQAAKPEAVPVQFRFKNPKDLDAATANGRCLSCHESGLSPVAPDGLHLASGLRCTACHTGMGEGGLPGLRRVEERRLCGSCHGQAVAPFRSGHRLDRAGSVCTFCHDPHGRDRHLLARDSTSCHKTYAYPKPFEHPPVEEGCLGCHSQLESFHRVDQTRSPFQLYEGCQNCHPRIHGTDALGGYRFQR